MTQLTDIKRKALALLNECAGQEVYGGWGTFDPNQSPCTRALCRAIEQHEAFRQEVSDAVEAVIRADKGAMQDLKRFVITEAERLAEAWNSTLRDSKLGEDRLEVFRTALAARGLKIVEDK